MVSGKRCKPLDFCAVGRSATQSVYDQLLVTAHLRAARPKEHEAHVSRAILSRAILRAGRGVDDLVA